MHKLSKNVLRVNTNHRSLLPIIPCVWCHFMLDNRDVTQLILIKVLYYRIYHSVISVLFEVFQYSIFHCSDAKKIFYFEKYKQFLWKPCFYSTKEAQISEAAAQELSLKIQKRSFGLKRFHLSKIRCKPGTKE